MDSAYFSSHKNKQKRTTAILFFLFVECIVGCFVWKSTRPVPSQGYVVKNGSSYILLWRNNDQSMESMRHSTLQELLEYADKELLMVIGPNPTTKDFVNNVWVREERENKLVFWQSENTQMAHRLTFRRPQEASVFESAFRSGAYSTSPYGHSISLVRKFR